MTFFCAHRSILICASYLTHRSWLYGITHLLSILLPRIAILRLSSRQLYVLHKTIFFNSDLIAKTFRVMLCACVTLNAWSIRDVSATWTMYHMSCNSFERKGVSVFIREHCAYNMIDVFSARRLVLTRKG